jgi:hypothetical protein
MAQLPHMLQLTGTTWEFRVVLSYWRQRLGFDVTLHEIPSATPGTLRHATYQHHLERDYTHDELAAEEVELEQRA